MTQPAIVDCEPLKRLVRHIPDFPKPGVLFYDITPLLKNPTGLATLVDALALHYLGRGIELVLGVEARGFIFGPALAYRLNAGFVPVRKKGKLPARTLQKEYALEYGSATLELHHDAVSRGQRVLVVDDLLATGGTAEACIQLAQHAGAAVAGAAFVVELTPLGGRQRLAGHDITALLQYGDAAG
jgi:adenine phosphoribosyltransferase